MEQTLISALNEDTDSVPLGRFEDYTEEQLDIIFDYKTHVYDGFIYLCPVKRPHQRMAALLSYTFTENDSVGRTFLPITSEECFVFDKFSCGSVHRRQVDFCVERIHPPYVQPLVAEVSFRNETLPVLLIEAANLLAESTSFEYCIAMKLDGIEIAGLPLQFHAHFFVLQRTVETDEALQEKINGKNCPKIMLCSKVDKHHVVNQELFDKLHVRRIFYREITLDNYREDFQFTLEGSFFNVPDEFVTFTVYGIDMIGVNFFLTNTLLLILDKY